MQPLDNVQHAQPIAITVTELEQLVLSVNQLILLLSMLQVLLLVFNALLQNAINAVQLIHAVLVRLDSN